MKKLPCAIDELSVEKLIEWDRQQPQVWLSWSWLSMIGVAYKEPEYPWYERLYAVKEEAQATGYKFRSDNFY